MQKMIQEALLILQSLGVPIDGLTNRRQARMAKAFLSVAGLCPGMDWAETKDNDDQYQLLSRQIITQMNAHWVKIFPLAHMMTFAAKI